MSRVLITGATGFLGRAVTARFLEAGWSVAALSRDPAAARAHLPAPVDIFSWESAGTIPDAPDAVVHLAGAPIAGSLWTRSRKRVLWESRVDATRSLIEALSRGEHRPFVFVSASGMGYYGDHSVQTVNAGEPAGQDFLGRLAEAWEREARAAETFGVRTVAVRLGMVLGAEGGALPPMRTAFRFGLGAVLGTGAQYWPWIHRDDAAEVFFQVVTNPDFHGPVHGAAGTPLTQREFSKTLAGVLRRPLLVRVPARALRLVAGEMADLFLHGQRVDPDPRLVFRHDSLDSALRAATGRSVKTLV